MAKSKQQKMYEANHMEDNGSYHNKKNTDEKKKTKKKDDVLNPPKERMKIKLKKPKKYKATKIANGY